MAHVRRVLDLDRKIQEQHGGPQTRTPPRRVFATFHEDKPCACSYANSARSRCSSDQAPVACGGLSIDGPWGTPRYQNDNEVT
eukprot:g31495.t1